LDLRTARGLGGDLYLELDRLARWGGLGRTFVAKETGKALKGVIDTLDQIWPKDDLNAVLATVGKAKYTLDGMERVAVNAAGVLEGDAKARRAERVSRHIGEAADAFEHSRCNIIVRHVVLLVSARQLPMRTSCPQTRIRDKD
jgi:hypothetical protein